MLICRAKIVNITGKYEEVLNAGDEARSRARDRNHQESKMDGEGRVSDPQKFLMYPNVSQILLKDEMNN